MRATTAFANDFFIILRKALGVSFILKALNFCYLFIMFRISFLIIYGSGFITCSYLKSFMLLKFVWGFSGKKLCRSMSTFFFIMRVVCYLG